jgi:hypothetical protein
MTSLTCCRSFHRRGPPDDLESPSRQWPDGDLGSRTKKTAAPMSLGRCGSSTPQAPRFRRQHHSMEDRGEAVSNCLTRHG